MTDEIKQPPAALGSLQKEPKSTGKSAANARELRLKAALKANMARRKAQARARSTAQDINDAAPPASE